VKYVRQIAKETITYMIVLPIKKAPLSLDQHGHGMPANQ
jgi:hypothetical protein